MAEEQQKLTSVERIQNKISELKEQTLNESITWNVITPKVIEEKKYMIIDNLNKYAVINEAYSLEKNNKIVYVGKITESYYDENDDIQRESDFFITFSDIDSIVLTSYTDNELISAMRKNNFSYFLAIDSVIGGKKKTYSSDIYRLIKEIKLQILDI